MFMYILPPVFGHRAPQSLSNVVGGFNCQVREWQAMCNRSEDRAYGVDLGLQERTLETKPFPWSVWWVWCGIWYVPKPIRNPLVDRFTAGMVDEFRVIFDIIDSNGSGELDLLGVKRACGLLGQKRLLDRRSNRRQFLRLPIHLVTPKMCFSSKRMRRHLLLIKVL